MQRTRRRRSGRQLTFCCAGSRIWNVRPFSDFMSSPFSGNPFYELKKVEMEILSRSGARTNKRRIERLRTLAKRCRRRNPDAEECICYHGALALIYEADGSLKK